MNPNNMTNITGCFCFYNIKKKPKQNQNHTKKPQKTHKENKATSKKATYKIDSNWLNGIR